jgi:pimeloyl-ACP methyl ester carboxylesterase/predicted glycosyltransferase
MAEQVTTTRTDPTRARLPDETGSIERDGVRIAFEVHGSGDQTVLLMPTWSIIHSRQWKMQVPYLARHYRVVTFDGRGNGASDRPVGPEWYSEEEFAADALAVLDETDSDRAVVVGFSTGAQRSMLLAASHPERVSGLVLIGANVPLDPVPPRAVEVGVFNAELVDHDGWFKYNRNYWRDDYEGFLEFFFENVFTEPHSTKPREDCVGWGQETHADRLADTVVAEMLDDEEDVKALAARVECPVMVIHGDEDAIRPWPSGARLAELVGATMVTLAGAGHAPHVRDPVKVNLVLREFIDGLAPAPILPKPHRWTRGKARPKRALYLSSPIGLGHARRDLAIADSLRELHPDLQIDWLAQHPVTTMLESRGEEVHPASAFLANESGHIEGECGDHDLHCFQAWRRMDEILLANFMVFHDLVSDDPYDLWLGDEAWELDYYLHENPEQKRSAYVWLTDFVGWLPMPDGGDHEAMLTADYNAEMIEHIARYPRLRDRSIFIGAPDDIVPDAFGPDLPEIRAWTEDNFEFSGDYITGFAPDDLDREEIREQLGYAPDERVCVVSVGGSGVGAALLRRVIDAYPAAARAVDGLRMIVVAGPRIDPARLQAPAGVEVRSFVPDLYLHLAACDLAVVQGGLTTTMELTATNTPFLYFPLGHHFEQRFHVPRRLARYGAGRQMEYAESTPDDIAAAIRDEIGKRPAYRSLDPKAAERVATRIAELL